MFVYYFPREQARSYNVLLYKNYRHLFPRHASDVTAFFVGQKLNLVLSASLPLYPANPWCPCPLCWLTASTVWHLSSSWRAWRRQHHTLCPSKTHLVAAAAAAFELCICGLYLCFRGEEERRMFDQHGRTFKQYSLTWCDQRDLAGRRHGNQLRAYSVTAVVTILSCDWRWHIYCVANGEGCGFTRLMVWLWFHNAVL